MNKRFHVYNVIDNNQNFIGDANTIKEIRSLCKMYENMMKEQNNNLHLNCDFKLEQLQDDGNYVKLPNWKFERR